MTDAMNLPIHQIMDVALSGRCWTASDSSCPRRCRRALGEAAPAGRCWTVSDTSCPRRCQRASDTSCPRRCRRALGEVALSGRQHTRTEGFSGHSTQAACKASHHITRWQRLGAAQRASHAMNRKHNQYTNNNTTNHVTIAM